MAEEKKPKIDLKTRLQKMGGQAGTAAGSSPAAIPGRGSVPPPSRPAPAIPIPPGLPSPYGSRPPGLLDPNNPLSALAAPGFRTNAPPPMPAAPPQPQRIEIDEGAIQQARSSVRMQMLAVAAILAVVGAGIGYLVGSGSAKSADHSASVADAHQLAKELTAAKAQMGAVADAVTEAKKKLDASSFPDGSDKTISALVIDFDGGKLAGKKLGALTSDITHDLVDLITQVQTVTAKKAVLVGNIVKNQKAVTEWFGFKGNPPYTFALVVDRDAVSNGALISPFATPLVVPTDKPFPDKLTLVNNKANVDVPRYTGAELKDRVALALSPGAESTLCGAGADTRNVASSLKADMLSLVGDIRKESSDSAALAGQTQKIGLVELSDGLIDKLNHVN